MPVRNHPKVTMINNVTPIRAEVAISHPGQGSFRAESYEEETDWCRRYENFLCRTCDNTRLGLSPWCPVHFPWLLAESTCESEEVSKEPRSLY